MVLFVAKKCHKLRCEPTPHFNQPWYKVVHSCPATWEHFVILSGRASWLSEGGKSFNINSTITINSQLHSGDDKTTAGDFSELKNFSQHRSQVLDFLGGCSIECIGLLCSLNNPTTISFIRDFKLNFNLKSSGQMVKNIFVLHQIVILVDKG